MKPTLFTFWIFVVCGLIGCTAGQKLTSYGAIGSDKSLYYYHKGSGEPIIVVHGGPGLNHRYLLPYMDRLADHHHIIYYDQRACGDSEIPTDTTKMRLSSFVEDIEMVRKKFGLKKIHLLAHSWGSLLAVQYAARHPQNVQSLILVSPAAISSTDVRESSKAISARFEYADQLKRNQIIESASFKNGQPEAMVNLIRLSFRQNIADKSLADSLNIYLPIDYGKKNLALRYLFKDLADYDFYPELKKISSPTLVIAGDQEIGLPQIEKIKSELTNSTYKIIKGSGHFPFLEQPALFDDVIRTHLTQFKLSK